ASGNSGPGGPSHRQQVPGRPGGRQDGAQPQRAAPQRAGRRPHRLRRRAAREADHHRHRRGARRHGQVHADLAPAPHHPLV
ncbi:MAG: hypothetical protein AVDCRST_MAG89-3670, partial [uncultured Gemmatimonadetes bacterium]